jgi:flagellar basal body-associated protein FliL
MSQVVGDASFDGTTLALHAAHKRNRLPMILLIAMLIILTGHSMGTFYLFCAGLAWIVSWILHNPCQARPEKKKSDAGDQPTSLQ